VEWREKGKRQEVCIEPFRWETSGWNGEKNLLNSQRYLLSRAAQFQAASFPKKGKIGQSTAFWGGMARNLWWREALSVE